MAGTGFEPPQESSGKTSFPTTGGAECGALDAQSAIIPPGLQLVIDAWATLPETTKIGILAMVRAAGELTE